MCRILLGAALLLASLPARAADTPVAAVNDFYAVYGPVHVSGGGLPDATQRTRYQPVLSPRLNAQIATAAAAQARMTAKVKNAVPPVLEGDIFSSLFEGATGWKVGTCSGDAQPARCPVALTHVVTVTPGGKVEKPANWNDILVVTNTAQGWKVDDVIYDAGFAFGNTGRLTGMLQMVLTVSQ